jgi:serine/threonine-protein kinase
MATEMPGSPQGLAGVQEGDLLAGKYRIETILGVGGMGVVVAAHHIQLDERVAIKFLLPEALHVPEAVARFAREARAAVKIKSEHVARVIDVGTLDTGAPYMVMEYLDGADLATRLHQQGPLSVDDAVTFALQTCEALADAHALGIIHRDLKPSNLFVTRRTDGTDCIKVLDFGISKVTNATVGGSNMAMTRTSTLMGSPLYMSPEQMASARNVDARSDIWALGVTLYELLAGVPPFEGETVTELCTKVLTTPTPRVRDRRPDVPEGLELVLGRCLQKDAGQRYPNVAALATALAELGPRRSRQSAERISRVLAAAGLSATALQPPPSTDPPPGASPDGSRHAGVLGPNQPSVHEAEDLRRGRLGGGRRAGRRDRGGGGQAACLADSSTSIGRRFGNRIHRRTGQRRSLAERGPPDHRARGVRVAECRCDATRRRP